MRLGLDYNHILEKVRALIQNPKKGIDLLKYSINLDWKGMFNREETQLLGLDIGSAAVKMVQLRKESTEWAVTAAGITDIAGCADNDNTGKEINTVSAISKCLQSTGVQTQLAVCGVCGPEVAVRYFKFPPLPKEEIEGAVRLEAAQLCPFNVDDSGVDYQLIPNGEDCTRGVLVAATNKLIETKKHLAQEAHLQSVLMDVDGLALLNCFTECEKAKAGQTIAILNVGSSYTTLVIMGDESLPFIRDMTYAGDDMIKEIANENSVRPEIVSRILTGHKNSNEVQLDISSNLAKACRKLVADVTDTLRYHTAQEKSSAVQKIYVCGGFALVKGFVELLNKQLPAEAVLWNPLDKINCDLEQERRNILQKNGPAMAVATGLAMRAI